MPPGKVYLVGAGPGDPGLVTLKGLECLARADLVLYDGLVNPLILLHTQARAERTNRRDSPQGRVLNQQVVEERHRVLGRVDLDLPRREPLRLHGARLVAEQGRHKRTCRRQRRGGEAHAERVADLAPLCHGGEPPIEAVGAEIRGRDVARFECDQARADDGAGVTARDDE